FVALGNPHFSFDECERLATLCECLAKHPDVKVLVTCNRTTFERASAANFAELVIIVSTDFGMTGSASVHKHASVTNSTPKPDNLPTRF
ncbi:aconitase X, partial [Rhizobium leguminosarum]|uniref:aconitase X n=1 Tax=Rhizobium leguminosarum TaxID=384 RepID=UPI003F9DF189